jgi:large subunit ribosomal protein L24
VIRYWDKERVVVENINLVKRHTKGNPMLNKPGGIVKKEMPLHISNVALFNSETNKADRVGFKFLEDGRKVRYFKSNNEVLDV